MSSSHHGGQHQPNPEMDALLKRFIAQVDNTATREYPHGRIGADDDGALVMAVTADHKAGTVVINFGKPVVWIGLRPADVAGLIRLLADKAREVATEPFTIDLSPAGR